MGRRSVTHATFVIERMFEAKPARVFQAFSDPAAKRRWFVEGEGWDVEAYEADFRVGGREHSRFRFRNDTTYQDIAPDERIIIAYTMTVGEARIFASLATFEFKPDNARTRLIFTEQGAFLDGYDEVGRRRTGTEGLLDALATELDRSWGA